MQDTKLTDSVERVSPECAGQLTELVRRAMMMVRGAGAAIALVDNDELITCATSGESVPSVGTRSPITGFTGLCVQKRETLACEDTQADARVDAIVCKALKINSMVLVPIQRHRTVLGVLAVFFGPPRGYTRSHVAMLRTLSDVAATVLERDATVQMREPRPMTVLDASATPVLAPSTVTAAPGPEKRPPALAAEVGVRVSKPAVPEREAARPAAATKPHSKRAPAAPAATAAGQEDVLVPAVDPRPAVVVPHLRNSEVPLFRTPTREPRSDAYRRVLLPLGATVVLAAIFAGLLLYRGARAKAAAPQAIIPAPAAAATISVPEFAAPQPAAPPEAPVTPTNVLPAVTLPPATEARPKATPPRETSAKPAPQPAPPEPIRILAEPSTEARPAPPTAPAEPPALTFADSRGPVVLPEPKPPTPAIAPQPSGKPAPSSYEPGRLLQSRPPAYPQLALAGRIEGPVLLRIKLGNQGDVIAVQSIKGHALLRQAAADAARTWRYAPAYQDGQPVESELEITVAFKLPRGF